MSRDQQHLKELLEESRRGYNRHDELPDEEILHVKPKPKPKKKKQKISEE